VCEFRCMAFCHTTTMHRLAWGWPDKAEELTSSVWLCVVCGGIRLHEEDNSISKKTWSVSLSVKEDE